MTRLAALAAALVLVAAPVAAPMAAQPVGARPPARADTAAPRLAPDRWLGADKAQHFFVAGFTYAGSFALARLAGQERRSALVTAAAPTALISVGKELRDRRVTGRFSVRDLVADALGAAAYAALLARTAR